jgi:hypothetical protein
MGNPARDEWPVSWPTVVAKSNNQFGYWLPCNANAMMDTRGEIVRQWVGHVERGVVKLYTHIADEASEAGRAARGRRQFQSVGSKRSLTTAKANGIAFQHKSSTTKGVDKMIIAQNKSSRRIRATAFFESGGHGARTRNRFPGTTFPVSPLAIRLPSEFHTPGPIVPARMLPVCYRPQIGLRINFS